MLLVRDVEGPARMRAGEKATFRVTRFNREDPPAAEAARVSWLVKTEGGTALTNVRAAGPAWSVIVPESWAGETIFVMPYMNSATRLISVRTEVAARTAAPSPVPVQVAIEQEGRRYYASVNGEPRFYVGTDVRYGSRRGLMNSQNPYGPRYVPEAHLEAFGFWAVCLWPTIQCESRGAFNCINTYDRARFTYGHMQFAAHTPDANFVRLLRELLALPTAGTHFPDLQLHDGRVHRRTDQGLVRLEDGESTSPLQDYLNPGSDRVDEREVEVAARFMDWCARDRAVAESLVGFSVRDQQAKLRWHARKLPLEGLSDKLCIVVLDILHQGRASYRTIRSALREGDPFDALLSIGLGSYRERISTLRAGILDLERRGLVGERVYSGEAGDFVPAEGA